jgi:hypothetical protein
MPSAVPTSKLWTLRLKRGKKTVLVFADPAQSLRSLKQNLLDALKATHSSNAIDGTDIPTSPSDVELGKPVDQLDLEQGWDLVDPPSPDDELASDDSDTKGKKRAKTKTRDLSLKALGIKENYVLAFRFKNPDEDVDETLAEDLGWDVDIPSYEDLYGEVNSGDIGVNPEYRG